MRSAKLRQRLGLPNLQPPVALGPVADDCIRENTLWSMGDQNAPLRADVLAAHANRAGLIAVGQFAASLKKNMSKPETLHGVHVDDDAKVFDKNTVSKWRSRARPCPERHPGLCPTDAEGGPYGSTLAFASRLLARVSKVSDDSSGTTVWALAGTAVYRFTSVATPLSPAGGQVRWTMLSFYMGKPRAAAFIELHPEGPAVDEGADA